LTIASDKKPSKIRNAGHTLWFQEKGQRTVQVCTRDWILIPASDPTRGVSNERLPRQHFYFLFYLIRETLRMYPPLPLLTRESAEDYKIPGQDFILEKGTMVFIPASGIHYDEDHYKNPKVFDPDRFSAENKKARHPYAHLPFGEGPRVCIGERFGILQSKVGLTSILKDFKVTLSEKTKLPLKMNPHEKFTSPIGGIWLKIEKV
ncbi:probable cytochrome P450 6a13, partial [Anoplophora glabripennis]|uniref:probable cytochrome P450 6a13 n=1 Tax=Anoplophora glabripennis TaxID=217634 RepID=UPI0008741E12